MATLISGSTGVNKITDGTITNADIASGAAIAGTKLVMPTGSVLQVVQAEFETKVTLNSATSKLLEKSITMKGANSSLLIRASVPIGGHDDGNADVDLALSFGYKTGGASSTSTNYSKAGGRSEFSRVQVSGLDPWFSTDTKRHGEGQDKYWIETKTAEYLKTGLSYAVGTAVHVALWAKTVNGAYTFISGETTADTDTGEVMTLTVMEIAG